MTHDPMFAPRRMAMAASKVIKLFIPRDITNPIKAVLLLKMPVSSCPCKQSIYGELSESRTEKFSGQVRLEEAEYY